MMDKNSTMCVHSKAGDLNVDKSTDVEEKVKVVVVTLRTLTSCKIMKIILLH
jgi:hypothetical protein